MALFRCSGGTGGTLTQVKLGSGSGSYDISAYASKPHICYAVVTGGSITGQTDAAGAANVYFTAELSSISITESDGEVTFSGGSGRGTNGKSWSNGQASATASVSYDAYIAYIG